MNKWDWIALIGYWIVAIAFSLTLYVTIKGAVAQKKGDAYAHHRRWRYNVFAAFVAAAWPISLPTCVVLATVAIMVGRKR